MVGGGAWAVATIQISNTAAANEVKTSNAVLATQVASLAESVGQLRITIRDQNEQIEMNRSDISELKGRLEPDRRR